nr:NTP transferase domain-containing protein [Cellulomonas uda]
MRVRTSPRGVRQPSYGMITSTDDEGTRGMNAVAQDGQREAIVVVLSGGIGARFGLTQPKQLTELGDRTVLEHTLWTVAELTGVRRVSIAANVSHLEQIWALASGVVLGPSHGWSADRRCWCTWWSRLVQRPS